MTELTLEMAEQAVRAAQARARALGSPMTVTVVDEGGRRGSPIMKNGRCIGGIGCGGGTGEQDQECSDAGAAAVK